MIWETGPITTKVQAAAIDPALAAALDPSGILIQVAHFIRNALRNSILLFDGWYLSEALVNEAARRHKKWISILKKNRNLETNSFQLKDADGQPIKFESEHVSVAEFVKQIPTKAFKMVVVNEKTY